MCEWSYFEHVLVFRHAIRGGGRGSANVTQCDRWGEGVVYNVMSHSGIPIIDFLPVEHRSYNSVFKISSKILTPPPTLKLTPKTKGGVRR